MNWQKLHNLSLRTKALLAVGLSVALGFAVLVTIIGYNVFDEARQSGYRQAREQANAYALDVEARFRAQFNVPRQLAKALQGLPSQTVPDRKTLDAMIIGMLKSVPEASGLWMLWEPNALDGKDDGISVWSLLSSHLK